MNRNARSKLNAQIYEEACEWFVEFRGGDLDAAARSAFDRWLRKSPEHLSAYLEVAAIWNEGPALDPQRKWDTQALIAQAAQDPDNVVPLKDPAPVESRSPPPLWGRDRVRGSLLAASVLVGAALIAWHFTRAPTYATAVGEQRSIALSDGSTVELNSRSEIKVNYSAAARDIELLSGQALFRVAKDTSRPFVVTSDGTRVRAIGTEFDVYKKRTGTVVTVVEGRVAISPLHPSPLVGEEPGVRGNSSTVLNAGEQLTVTPRAIQKMVRPNIATATAWTQRQLVFDSASLSEVAEEFNRYNLRQLVIEEPAVYDFHISGVFSSAEPASLIRFLRERPGVSVTEKDSEIRIARKIP